MLCPPRSASSPEAREDPKGSREPKELKKLRELKLDGNNIRNLSPLEDMKNLRVLSFSGDANVDLGPVRKLTGLQSLSVNGIAIDPGILSKMEHLRTFALSDVDSISVVGVEFAHEWVPHGDVAS